MLLARFALLSMTATVLSACATHQHTTWHDSAVATPQQHVDQGMALMKRGAYPAAINAFNRARKIQPSSQAELGLAQASFRLGKHQQAMSHIDQALVIDPDQAWTYVWRGRVQHEAGDTTEALESYNTALDLEPYCVPCLLARANAYHSAGLVDAAEQDTQRVLELEPDNAQARLQQRRLLGTQASNTLLLR